MACAVCVCVFLYVCVDRMTCQFPECGKKWNTFRSLHNHLMAAHAVPKDELKGHWVHDAFLGEKKGNPEVSHEEASWVELAWLPNGCIDEWSFGCKVCEKVFKKNSCQVHFDSTHGIPKQVVKNWLVCKDRWVLVNHKGHEVPDRKLQLTRALLAAGAGAIKGEGVKIEVEEGSYCCHDAALPHTHYHTCDHHQQQLQTPLHSQFVHTLASCHP